MNTNPLLSVGKSDLHTIFASGVGGTILITQDGGTTWDGLASNVPYNLYSIMAKNDNLAFAVGGDAFFGGGVFLRWDGIEWKKFTTGTNRLLLGVSFPNSFFGIVCGSGSTIRKTIDGGATWVGVVNPLTPFSDYHFYEVLMIDSLVGYISGNRGQSLKTVDGGSTWTQQQPNTPYTLTGIAFQDASNGIMCGDGGALVQTSDGGSTWTPLVGSVVPTWYRAASYADGVYMICGDGGNAYRSNDRVTWTKMNIGTPYGLTGVTVLDANNAIMVSGYQGKIFVTNDGGSTWIGGSGSAVPSPTFSSFPLLLDFGKLRHGQYRRLFITITNNGTAQLSVNGQASDQFGFEINGVSVPNRSFAVEAGTQMSIPIICKSTSNHTTSSKIMFTHNAEGSPFTLPVIVNG